MFYVNFSVKYFKCAPKWSLPYFRPILAAIFVTVATVKVKLKPDLYTWAIAIITNKKNLVESNYHFLTQYGGQNSLLLHVFVVFFSYIVKDRKFDVTYIINGLLGSLVAITGMFHRRIQRGGRGSGPPPP